MAEPTEQDLRNAENRAAIAARMQATYDECQRLADEALGPGYSPWMRLSLLESDYHQTGNTTPAATAFKVYKGELRLSENSMFIRRMPDNSIKTATNYEEVFGDMLHEPHPARKLEIKGEMVPSPRWTVCWGAMEIYSPRTAEQLATGRVSREKKKTEREQAKYERETPLFAMIDEKEGRGR